MTKFTPPATIDESKARKSDLLNAKYRIQRELSERKITANGSGGSPEYRRWRKAAVLKICHIDTELRALNDWQKEFNLNYRRVMAAGSDAGEVEANFAKAARQVLNTMKGLVEENRELRVENDRLRAMMGEPVTTQAPGDGVDEWREQS